MNHPTELIHEHELRLRHLKVMERITQIDLSTEKFEDALSQLLDAVLETFDADRASLLHPCDPDAPCWSVPMERTRPEWPGLFTLQTEMPRSQEISDVFSELLAAPGPLSYGPDAERPVPSAVAETFSIKSQIMTVLRPKLGAPWLLVMHHCAQPQSYSVDAMRLFSAVAKRIGDTLSGLISINRLRESEERLQLAAMVYQHSSEAMMVTDAKNNIIAINPAFTRMTGYAADEVLGRNPHLLSSGRHDANFYQSMWRDLRANGSWQGEIWNRRKNGEEFAEMISINTIYDEAGGVHRFVALFSDITQKKVSEEIIWRQAHYDALTQLPNRSMFHDLLSKEIEKANHDRLRIGVLFIDLDRFKEVNDTLGHHIGDLLLIEAANRILATVGSSGMVARLGGDEFTVILSPLGSIEQAGEFARQVLEQLSAPFKLAEELAFVSASIGITFYPDDSTDIEHMLKYADQAMYAAKSAGRNRYSFFTPEMQQASETRMRLINDMHAALAAQQFRLVYQPIIELATGHIHKAEALVRWAHPVRNLIGPAEFIPIAEQTGMILKLGDWVFRQAAHQVKEWRDTIDAGFQVSVNMSPVQFQNEADFGARAWITFLRELGMPGSCISVEITEGLLLDTAPLVTTRLLEFRDAGIQVSLDDFGTGYSSLSYLKKFDIDYIKIDQSFVRNLETDSHDNVLCEAIIVMAHKLGLKVIAEGVETEGQRRRLAAAGCDYAQGYLFSKPVPAEDFVRLIRQ